MTWNQKRIQDRIVHATKNSPAIIPNSKVIFVLPSTVTSIYLCVCFPYAVRSEKVMHITNGGLGTLPNIYCLINKIINLPGNPLTTYSKQTTFPWCLKIYRARLLGIGGDMHLLCIIILIVDSTLRTYRASLIRGWFHYRVKALYMLQCLFS